MMTRTALLAAFIAMPFTAIPTFATSVAAAEPRHDGKWSVEIVTEKGWCDVYRWDIGVAGGRVVAIGAP